MKKIGTTLSGTVIVEMTASQFEALSQIPKSSQPQPAAATMSVAEQVIYARERLAKLTPKKKEGVAHSISAMFQFTGGISETQIQEIITRLEREKFFTIDQTDRVAYQKANQPSQPKPQKRRG